MRQGVGGIQTDTNNALSISALDVKDNVFPQWDMRPRTLKSGAVAVMQ